MLSNTVLGLLVVVLVGLLAGTLLGYKAFTIRSGSMTPALGAGDVVVDRSVPPLSVHPGEIVTFRDPALGGLLVTHRVVSVHRAGQQVHFVTKGDANVVTEHWSTHAGESVGREVLIVRKVGFVLADVSTPLARVAEVAIFSVCVAWIGLRRVWRRPHPSVAGRRVPQVAFR